MKNASMPVRDALLAVLTRTIIPTEPWRRSARATFDDFSVTKVPLLRGFRGG